MIAICADRRTIGRKQHIAVDTLGLLLTVLITAAGIQDRDAAKPLLWNRRRAFPSIWLTWADGGPTAPDRGGRLNGRCSLRQPPG
jgi:hypothetical protein